MNYKAIYLISSILLSSIFIQDAQAQQICGKKAQGQILQGKAEGFDKIIINNKKYSLASDGAFLVTFDRDAKQSQTIVLLDKKGAEQKFKIKIAPTKWDIQNLKGVPQKKVTPAKVDEKPIIYERNTVRGAQNKDTEQSYWKKGFIQPVDGRISGYFGGQRIMNGTKMNPHAGTDIAAPTGTPVKASSDGIVTLAEPNLFYSGNVIIIDHGQNLFTIYAHLSRMDVKKGDKVRQGDIIGLVGQTGRATGPHLHWGASLHGIKFNPFSLLKLNNNDNFCLNLSTNIIESE